MVCRSPTKPSSSRAASRRRLATRVLHHGLPPDEGWQQGYRIPQGQPPHWRAEEGPERCSGSGHQEHEGRRCKHLPYRSWQPELGRAGSDPQVICCGNRRSTNKLERAVVQSTALSFWQKFPANCRELLFFFFREFITRIRTACQRTQNILSSHYALPHRRIRSGVYKST